MHSRSHLLLAVRQHILLLAFEPPHPWLLLILTVYELLYCVGHPDSSSTRTPAFLHGATFHFPDEADSVLKWLKGRVHELQRIRRAFEYTLNAVEEKWRGNFSKLQGLLEQRGAELAVLQRKLLLSLTPSTHISSSSSSSTYTRTAAAARW